MPIDQIVQTIGAYTSSSVWHGSRMMITYRGIGDRQATPFGNMIDLGKL
jgi:hypothetical protein